MAPAATELSQLGFDAERLGRVRVDGSPAGRVPRAGPQRALLGLCSLIAVAVGGFWVLSSLPA